MMAKADLPSNVDRHGHKRYTVRENAEIDVYGTVELLRENLAKFPDDAIVSEPVHWGDGCYGDHTVVYERPATEAETNTFWKLEVEGAAKRRADKQAARARRIEDAKRVLAKEGVL